MLLMVMQKENEPINYNILKEELIELYKQENKKYNYVIFSKINDIRGKLNNPDIIELILDFERYVIYNKGSDRFKVEETILELLQMHIINLCASTDFDVVLLNENLVNDTLNIELKNTHRINFSLLNFAKEIFNISIPRDSYSSRRKGYALGIIRKLMEYYEIPNKFELFIEALQSPKNKLIIEALDELHYYFENIQGRHLPDELLNVLDKIILITKDRTIATGALNLQVITRCISKFEAVSRIDDWKEKFYYD